MTAATGPEAGLRLDKLLWYLRFCRSRSLAQALILAGHIRLDGRRVLRASAVVRAGQILVLPLGKDIAVIRIIGLPPRRGPAAEAAACYERLNMTASSAPA